MFQLRQPDSSDSEKRLNKLSESYTRLFSVEVLSAMNFKEVDAWKMLVDAGLNRAIKWNAPSGETLVAYPVQMLNRVGLVSHIMDSFIDSNGNYNEGPFALLTFDIHDFDAYNIKKRVGDSVEVDTDGGDFMINRISQTVKMACNELVSSASQNKTKDTLKAIPARYGGDELAILIDGRLDDQDLQDFADYIKTVISEIPQSPYQTNTGEIQTRKAKVKSDKVNIIKMPEEGRARDVFIQFLTNNSILESEELDKILEDFEDEGLDNTANKLDIYPEYIISNIDKLRWITSNNESFSKIIAHLKDIENLEKQQDTPESEIGKITKKALTFFEHTLFNDIFQHKMLPYVNFVESVSHGDFNTLCVFEVAFLKEINTNFNLARGDKMLVSFFQKILQSLKDVGIDDAVFSRKGSTFLVGINNQSISEHLTFVEILKKNIKEGLKFEYKGEIMNLPCGFSTKLFTETNLIECKKRNQLTSRHFTESNKIISSKRKESELLRSKNMCNEILTDTKGFQIVTDLLEKQLNAGCVDEAGIVPYKYYFWVTALTGNEPIGDYTINKKTFPIRFVSRCKDVKQIFSDLKGFRKHSKKGPMIDKFLEVLDQLIFNMEQIQPVLDQTYTPLSGSEEIEGAEIL